VLYKAGLMCCRVFTFFRIGLIWKTCGGIFEFTKARTVHESSLSPCVHSILAARIGNMPKAYELYSANLASRHDDYNREVHEGLHITSMAGTWISIVEGLAAKGL
jgi:maltose phosphorylase